MIGSPEFGICTPSTKRIRHIHCIGIGGAGMCGIAEVLKNQGYELTGSDLEDSPVTRRLRSLGIGTAIGHEKRNLGDADVVVVSSAIPESNPELAEARARRIPVVPRAEMLGELMRSRFGIAVSGTHGKTTTTSFLTGIFQVAGLDPTYVIGGLLNRVARPSGLGLSRYLLAEADESDASLLFLHPKMVVITNIDHDHMGTYGHDFSRLQDTFVDFVGRLPFYGVAVVCIDDEPVSALIPRLNRPVVTYGLSAEADYRATITRDTGAIWRYRVSRPKGSDLEVEVPLPGVHNVLNSLAAVAVAGVEGVADHHIVAGLRDFSGVGRRFETAEIQVCGRRVTLVDDYGHHPTELDSVLDTVRRVWPKRRILMVYQPHRYSRTRDLFTEFVESLVSVDELILVETYSAGEPEIEGADGRCLARAVERRTGKSVIYVSDAKAAGEKLRVRVHDNDVVVVQGAGNVSMVSEELLRQQIRSVGS